MAASCFWLFQKAPPAESGCIALSLNIRAVTMSRKVVKYSYGSANEVYPRTAAIDAGEGHTFGLLNKPLGY